MEVFFSQLLKERDTLKQGAQTILGSQAKFLIFPPPPPPNVKVLTSQCEGTTYSYSISDINMIFCFYCAFGSPTRMRHRGNCPLCPL